jgi:hypothetical protein
MHVPTAFTITASRARGGCLEPQVAASPASSNLISSTQLQLLSRISTHPFSTHFVSAHSVFNHLRMAACIQLASALAALLGKSVT